MSLYYSFIYPYLYYCNIIWGHAAKCHLLKLLNIQKRAVRIILNKGYRNHSLPLFTELNILSVFEIAIYCKCLFMFEFLSNRLPPMFDHLFSHRINVHSYSTHNMQSLNLPLCRSEMSRKFLTYSGPFLFNQLLNHPYFLDYRSLSKSNFKTRLDKLVRTPFFVNLY